MRGGRVRGGAVLLCLLLALAACAGEEAPITDPGAPEEPGDEETTEPEPDATTPDGDETADSCEVKVGFFGPLTGDAADIGNDTLHAVEMAFEEATEAGDVTLDGGAVCEFEVVGADDELDVERGVAAVEHLLEVEQVDVIVGGIYSPLCLAVLDRVQESGVPWINPVCATISFPAEVAERELSRVFSTSPTNLTRGTTASQVMLEVVGVERLAMVFESGDAGRDEGETVRNYMAENAPDVEIVMEEYQDPGTTDFGSVLAQLRRLEPDFVYSSFIGVATMAFAQQYCESGIEAQPMSGFVPVTFVDDLGDCSAGWLIGEIWSPRAEITERSAAFVNDYEERYGKLPWYGAAQAYDASLFVQEAIRHSGSIDPEKVAGALEEVEITGVRGVQSFNPLEEGHTVDIPLVFAQVGDDLQSRTVWPEEASEVEYERYQAP